MVACVFHGGKCTQMFLSFLLMSFIFQTKEKVWSWHVGSDKLGVFEIDWQQSGKFDRIALALECRQLVIIDVSGVSLR